MGLKEIYLAWEDKWYNFLDKIDAHVPVYKAIDRIDAVVPSFAVFLLIILCLAVLGIALIASAGQAVQVTLIVEDGEGNLLPGVKVDYIVAGRVNSGQTNQNGELIFSVPPNSSIELSVGETTISGVEFEGTKKTIFVESGPVSQKIVLLEKEPDFVERTLLFQNAAGERITGKAIKVRLSCQNPLVTPSPIEATDFDMDGSIEVKEPKDCGVFQATIVEPSEFRQLSYILDRATQSITLEALDVARGSIRAKIKDSAGNIVVSANFEVSLLDADGLVLMQKYTQNYGEALFSGILAGNYSLSVADSAGQYAIASVPGIEVSANETAVADVIVSKTVKATIRVKVVDKANKAPIANADVKLLNAENETVAEQSTGSNAAEVVLRLTEQGNYTVFASHADYLYETVEVQNVAGEKSITIELEKITGANSGRVEVKVLDEDNVVVQNAKVKLRFLDTGMLVPIEPRITDSNGLARFSGVKPGKYYAYVEKFPAFGDNKAEGKEIDIRQVTRFTVKLVIGDCTVKVKAFDEDMQAAAEAEAEFFAEDGTSLGKIPLTDGSGQFELKADKKAFVVVTHPDYMAVQTMPEQLWPGKTIEFKALMEPRLILGGPKIQFEGITDLAGQPVQMLKAGNRYIARFKLSIPEEGNYKQGGIHFRTGDEALLINDPLAIKEAIAGGIDAPLKGTSFTPPNGYGEDAENITEGEAKWVNIFWQNLEPKNYYVGFEIRVKSQITPYTRLAMHYRVWATDDSGDYIRAPDDSELGNAESIANKQALYAKTLDLAFLEGQAAECQDDFCYSGESILDEDKGLYIYEPYEMRNGSPHKFTFNILNNSLRQYENSKLYITVNGMTIDSYKIQNASSQEFKAENVALKAIDGIDLGAFTKGKSIDAEVHFIPNALGNASVEVKVIADARVVFLKTITAAIVSEREMEISIEPEYIPSYVATSLQVKLTEKEQKYEVENAIVRIIVRNPDKTLFFYNAKTNGFGIALFSLPPLQPNAIVRIEAEKPGYYAAPKEITIDGDVLRFDPAEIEVSMNTRDKREYMVAQELENLAGVEVTIVDVALSGQFKGLLDEQTMLNFSRQFVGKKIAGLASETVQFFEAKLSENAESLLLGREKLEGEYTITAMNNESLATWDIIVPLKVSISVGGLPDNAPCIILTRREWDGVTQQNKATIEFEVQNNCMSGGNFVALDSLKAKVNWESDEIGIVELNLIESGTNASNSAVLRTQVWTNLFGNIRPEAAYYAMLTFTPKAGHLGETAKFSVNIDGEILTDSGLQFVGASPSSIKSQVKVVNLEGCVVFPEDNVWIKPGQKDVKITIDSTECGNTEVDFALCWQDPGCRGGTQDGYVQLSTDTFSLRPERSEKEIMVSRGDLPGAYGVTVYAKLPGTSYRKIGEIIVNVAANSGAYWDLDKYTFSVIGAGGSDSAMLSNKMLEESVDVTASVCAWGEAQEDKDFNPVGAALGAGLGSTAGTMLAVHIVSKAIANATTASLTLSAMRIATNGLTGTALNAIEQSTFPTAYDAASQVIWSQGFGSTAAQNAANQAAVAGADAVGASGAGVALPVDAAATASAKGAAEGAKAAQLPGYAGPIVGGIATYIITGDPVAAIASTVGGYIGLMVCGPVCGIIGSIVGSMLSSLFGADPCDKDLTNPLPDFVINLSGSMREYQGEKIDSDALDIAVMDYEGEISGLWNTIDRQVNEDKEEVGVVFTNSSGIEQVEPIYAVGVFSAKEHIHGDVTHTKAHVDLGDGSGFAPYAVPDTSVDEHVQRFHLRFKTKNIPRTIPPISYDSYECTQGTMIGRTGPGALPRVKFDWSWSNETGIGINSCDYGNEDYIYCDATQFAIELSKRMQKVEEFMNANNYQFSCPTNGGLEESQSRSAAYNLEHGSQTVDANTLGLKSMNFNYAGNVLTVNVAVENQGRQANDATATVIVAGSSGNDYEETCSKGIAGIAGGSTKTVQCVFNNVLKNSSPYHIAASISSNTTAEIDNTVLLSTLLAADQASVGHCWLPPSTDYYQGIPGVSYYIDSANPRVGKYVTDQSIAWTNDVQNPEDLAELAHFKAYLMQDGYGTDFRQDFADFYITNSFFDAPTWFASDAKGRLADYFADDDAMAMAVKYTMDDTLPGPGIYNVDISITYSNDKWALFDVYGKKNAKIFVQMYRLKEPEIDSVFYYLPFDGYVGLKSADGRQFYGMNYINIDEPIPVVSNPELLTTAEIGGSNSRFLLTTEIEKDFKRINSVASDRGIVLDVKETAPYSLQMVFSPNYATPVVMKMNSEKTDEPFSAFYELRESGTAFEMGSNLTFWDGAGQCLDFEGVPVAEQFDFKPDREANGKDALDKWQFAYAVDWAKADYAGDVYLKTIFYTPIDRLFSLSALKPSSLRFIAPNSAASQSVELNGIAGMANNSTLMHQSAGKIEDVFKLVSSQHLCVTNSGTRAAFWWNPRALYETAGSYNSVKAIEQGLVAEKNCIGYGS